MKSGPILSASLANVVLRSPDPDRAAEFYQRLFGFERFYADATCCFLRTGRANLVFVRAEAPTEGACLDFSVPDLALAAEALGKASIPFDKSSEGLLALHDPDGTLVEVVCG